MPGGTLGYGVELLLLSQGQGRDLCVVCYISNEGRWWDGEGLAMALVLLRHLSVRDRGSTYSTLCGCTLPLLIFLLARHLLVRLSWDLREGSGQGTDPRTCL